MKRILVLAVGLLLLCAPALAITQNNLTDGAYSIIKFNGTGTMNWTCPTGVTNVSLLVVAGGGGGGGGIYFGGGGGAGGLIYNASYPVSADTVYSVTVGAGGNGGVSWGAATNGANSSFSTQVAIGGGRGATCNNYTASSGGSGGGSAGQTAAAVGSGTTGQGNNGGAGYNSGLNYGGGGGGGANATGSNGSNVAGGRGGNGTAYSITGASVYYAGGGGGSIYLSGTIGAGGLGGGGDGGIGGGINGTNDLGGGGGGAERSGNATGGKGGDGVVILRYLTPLFPVAAFSANVTTGDVPVTVAFTDASTNTPTSWLWQFGDGNTSPTQSPTHTYYTAGSYSVNLQATNLGGSDWENKTNYLTFTDPTPPVANFTANRTTGYPGYSFQFNDSSSNTPVSWAWSWGDLTANGTTQNPTHVYAAVGTYTVTLTATNGDGSGSLARTNYITISPIPPPPVVAFICNKTYSATSPVACQFTQQCTGTVDTYAWDFGDGTTSTEASPCHTYATGGYYTVSLTCGNAGGNSSATYTQYVHVVQHYTRATATGTLTPIPTEGYHLILESIGGNRTPANETEARINWTMMALGIVTPYTDILGTTAWVLLFAIVFIPIWLMTGESYLPGIVGIILGPFLYLFMPEQWKLAPLVFIALGITTIIYSLYTRRR